MLMLITLTSQVGFFPCECVEVIGDKLPQNLNLPPSATSAAAASPATRKVAATSVSLLQQQVRPTSQSISHFVTPSPTQQNSGVLISEGI
jgi:hypothetical protein